MEVVDWQTRKTMAPSPEERLERGEILSFSPCPFTLPVQENLAFLCEQKLGGISHKNISYNPQTCQATGFYRQSRQQADRLGKVLAQFGEAAENWLASLLPRYAPNWRRDRVSFRPEEEATRKLRLTARNDLLHVDTFPSRPTQGYRILRLFVNINPVEPRVWVTADSIATLLNRYGKQVGLPQNGAGRWAWKIGQGLLNLWQSPEQARGDYDRFMLRLHHFLKANEEYQEQASRKFWHFGPGTAWLAFTDGFSHAELRGRFALEQSMFVAPQSLVFPDEAPVALLQKLLTHSLDSRAA